MFFSSSKGAYEKVSTTEEAMEGAGAAPPRPVLDTLPSPPALVGVVGVDRNGTSSSPRGETTQFLSLRSSQLAVGVILSLLLVVIASMLVFFNEGRMLEMHHETLSEHSRLDGKLVDKRLPLGSVSPHELEDSVVTANVGDGAAIEPGIECKNRRGEHLGRSGPPVQYIHVPKAGGTTIQFALLKWGRMSGFHTYLHNGDHEKDWKCPEQRVSHGVVMGHRGFGYCDYFQKIEGAMYVVALREPVSKFVSEFDYFMGFHIREFKKYRMHWANRDLNDIVLEYNHTLHEGYPKGHPKLVWPHAFVSLAKQQTAFMCGHDCIGVRGNVFSDEEKIQRALDNLRKCDVVTIMEELDEFITQIRMHVNWVPKGVQHFPRDNKHKGKHSELTEQAKEIVREWARPDVILYEEAQRIHRIKTDTAKKCLKEEADDDEKS